ncbi:PLP-dependent aminotransferase family protein [Accumulibacter sp.]|uniref:aminotransferase-like domain-containing protein n=1 Tax=Accumulibacter sp. TaxID=2053492 RepID=UPI0026342498|nr:PLP-dependent aminotransferase family protein [Accumulibacter sp.]
MDQAPLYRRLVDHYRVAIETGSLVCGDRFPSIRTLMARHQVSLSTALQVCRQLESDGWLEARPRSGNFVRQPLRLAARPLAEPVINQPLDAAQYVGIHARVSEFIARCRQGPVRVNFSRARGAPSLYPGQALRNAAARALRRHPELLVDVGPHNGNAVFRSVLAKRAMSSGMLIGPEEIVVTQGCIEALNLALRAVTQAGDIVAVESPTFYGLLQILESLGLRALEIPTSPQTGISLEALELATRIHAGIKALVVIPHLQNPLGSIMPDEYKARLVAFCEEQGIPLIEDDTYGALCDGETPPRALKAWDRAGNVIHCASLHKILAPGMRLGWISGGRWQARVEMFKHAQTHCNEQLSQLAAADFMSSSAYDRHLRQLRGTLRRNRQRMADAISAYFPGGTRLNHPNGGLTLWVELAGQISSQRLFDQALRDGILVAPGRLFSNSERCEHFVRLGCGWPYGEDVDRAMQRLGQLCQRLIEQGAKKAVAG